jgi:hypothetical protein
MAGWTIDFSAFRDAARWIPEDGLCGARTRAGYPCRGIPVFRPPGTPGRARCRLHGGKSTGPRTPEGRARIAESNRRRATSRAKSGQS